MLRARTAAVIAISLPAAFLVTACGDSSVSASDVESQIEKQLGPKLPQPIDSMSCPGSIKTKVGETENCALTYKSGDKVEVRVTITKVTDSKASFDLLVTKRLA